MLRTIVITLVMSTLLALTAGCQVFGYNDPVAGSGSSWEHVETIDGTTGASLTLIRTRSNAGSLVGRFISLFSGRPSFSYVCADGRKQLRIDWREAVGSPDSRRRVRLLLDGEEAWHRLWSVASSGRQSIGEIPPGFARRIGESNSLTAHTVNSGGNPVLLVFNVRGFAAAASHVDQACV